MHETAGFVTDLAVVLGVAALTGALFRRLNQSSVLGYLCAGLLVGPYLPLPILADPHRIEALSEFGVVLVMFAVGLELRLARLAAVLPVSGLTALVQISTMLWLGITAGQILGWSGVEAFFLGACLAISSTMVVSRAFDQTSVEPTVRRHVFGVLVIQDVVAIALIAVLTGLAAGRDLSAVEVASIVGRLVAVLAVLVAVGLFLVPRFVRLAAGFGSSELLLVVVAGVCFGLAVLAEELGFSVALGAFVAGVLVAESGESERVEHLVAPVRDLFAAVFFVSVGMTVDPRLAWDHAGTSAVLALVVVVGQLVSVGGAGLLSGFGLRRAILAGLSLGQIGEFAFVMAAIGISSGVVQPALRPVVVTVAVLTAFTTTLLLGLSERIVHAVDHYLPRRLQTSLLVYEGWIDRFRRRPDAKRTGKLLQAVRALVFDLVGLLALGLATYLGFERLVAWLGRAVGVPAPWAPVTVVAAAVALAAPLVVSMMRASRALALALADAAIGPTGDEGGRVRVAHRLLRIALQLVVILALGLPAIAVARPFHAAPYGLLLLAGLVLLVVLSLWQAAREMNEEVRSALVRLVELLGRQRAPQQPQRLEVQSLLPGLDSVLGFPLAGDAYAVGKTLAELDLRARTGGSVLAIHRQGSDVLVPTGHERLETGDLLVLSGSASGQGRARRFLETGSVEP